MTRLFVKIPGCYWMSFVKETSDWFILAANLSSNNYNNIFVEAFNITELIYREGTMDDKLIIPLNYA